MRQLDYDYPCNSTPAMGFHLVIADDYSRGLGSGALHTVEELLVELGVARVVAQGNRAYWQGISGERGHACGDTLIVYRKGLVLKRCCSMWMMGLQMEWNIWMGGSVHTGRGEVHARRPCYSRTHHRRSSIPSSLVTSLSKVLSHLLPTSMKTG